jgi:addiction module HigA family antidote
MPERDFGPLHPGEVLLEEFLIPLSISQHQLALHMRVAQQKINDIVRGRRGITPDTALRLAQALGTTAEFWFNLQQEYDLEIARQSYGERINNEVMMVAETKETYCIELDEYPDYPAARTPTKSDCVGYKYMSMAQLCNIAESFGIQRKGRSFACNAFGGDRGALLKPSDRQCYEWRKGGYRIKRFVLISAVEKFFKVEGLPWK